MKTQTAKTADVAPSYTVTLSPPAAAYVAELVRKFRVTPEQVIQAAAELELSSAFEHRYDPQIGDQYVFEDMLIEAALDIGHDGIIDGVEERWKAREIEAERAEQRIQEVRSHFAAHS